MLKYEVVGNENYAAQCIRVERLIDLEGLDNLRGLPWAGYTALVPKDIGVGDLVVVFPAEAQLERWVCAGQNLYAQRNKNIDTTVKGYLGNNGRVRAIRLRGHTSSALVLPAYAFGNPPEGTVFDTLDGTRVCQKYVLPHKESRNTGKKDKNKKRNIPFFPIHYDTAQYFRHQDDIGEEEYVVVTQKLHGTSVRFGRVNVERKLSWIERLAKRLGVRVDEWEKELVVGSRKVIKGEASNENYYDSDIWTEVARPYADLIPDNMMVFGEIIGWVGDTPIQKDYTYRIPKGEHELYVYRVAVVADDGAVYDLPWDGVVEFCNNRGMQHVVELAWGTHAELQREYHDMADFMDQDFHNGWNPSAVPLADESPVDEGVVIRWDGGITPTALKIKGPIFYRHETDILDQEVEDIEEEN